MKGKRTVDKDYSDADRDLLKLVARGDPLCGSNKVQVSLSYQPIFRHPLPVSPQRYEHEKLLRHILTFPLDHQARGAVTLRNAWVLEEVLLRGAPAAVPDENKYTPLHIACHHNDIECVMVLVNFGVDVNCSTISGVTPMYMAVASNATQVIEILQKANAKLISDVQKALPGATILEVECKSHNSVLHAKGKSVGLPHEHTMF